MDTYRINVKDLCEDEVNYELSIRKYAIDEPLDAKRRTLRKLLKQDEDPNLTLITHYELERDYRNVPFKLEEIESAILDCRSTGCFSRLVHYHRRIRRYVPQSNEEKNNQRMLLYVITNIAKKYYAVDFSMALRLVPTFRLVTGQAQRTAPVTPHHREVMVESIWERTQSHISPEENVRSHIERNQAFGLTQQPEPNFTEEDGAIGGLSNSFRLLNPFLSDGNNPVQCESGCESRGARPKTNLQGQCESDLPKRLNEGDRILPRRTINSIVPCSRTEQLDSVVNNSPGVVFQTSAFEREIAPQKPVDTSRVENSPIQPSMWEFPTQKSGRQEVVAASSPAPRGSTTVNRNESEYIHASEIELYVKSYLEKIVKNDSRHPLIHDAVIKQLTDQITNVGLHDTEVSRISRGIENRITQVTELAPPLQLSSNSIPKPTMNDHPPNLERWHIPSNFTEPRTSAHPLTDHPPRVIPDTRGNTDIPYVSSPQGPFRRLPHQQCNIIEKWPKFSGDNSPIPVTDFLRQIDILCRSYAITKEDLRMHAHLLFKDSACVWYTTYEEKFDSWQTLEFYLKMRYDNPNRDRIIKEELRNRKQRPNELFSAFLTDIETLAQRMNHKMSERDKFELIIENMKVSYKRRLALEPIHSIEHLAQLCFKFDALEPNLYHVGGMSRPVVHQVEVEEDADDEVEDSDEHPVCVLQGQSTKFTNREKTHRPKPADSRNEFRSTVSSTLTCWNCGQTGHMWRDCTRKKVLFCHICGRLETTANRCPNQHNETYGNANEEKNE